MTTEPHRIEVKLLVLYLLEPLILFLIQGLQIHSIDGASHHAHATDRRRSSPRLFPELLSEILKVLADDRSRGLLMLKLRTVLKAIVLGKLEIITLEELLVAFIVVGVCFLELLVVILLSLIQHFVDEVHGICSIIFVTREVKIMINFLWSQIHLSICWLELSNIYFRVFCGQEKLASIS